MRKCFCDMIFIVYLIVTRRICIILLLISLTIYLRRMGRVVFRRKSNLYIFFNYPAYTMASEHKKKWRVKNICIGRT